ncbi:MAG: carboxypeptidase-like regulatory domain-containing protein, partial [Candidatus Caldatribacteriota bacterium]|nr:carboxypeptidase-like regulatory domain-containing protein [Candidatus Caldatribacteriota bacterium]
MKTNLKIILPLVLISALLLLFAGCMVTPSDESPGVTGTGTIIGTIASPCCSLSADPVAETCCVSPEYWCYYCQQNWNLQDGIEVVLTYGENKVATTTTNEDGEYTFNDVAAGHNYVVTAYCPDYTDNRPLVKDVALEVASTFDTKITDLVSTSLGLVVDFLVYYTEWGPEDISLDEVIADQPTYPNFPKFKALIYEVRRVLENCELNLLTDDDVQYATCRAAEEISGLEIGCGPGYTPPPPPPGACDGNIAPSINSVLLDGTQVSVGETVHVIVGNPYVITVNASDDGIKDPLVFYASVDGTESPATTLKQITITPTIPGTFEVYAFTHDGCVEEQWGPITVEVHDECYGNTGPYLTMPDNDTVDPGGSYSWNVIGSDPDNILGTLTYS